MTAPDPHAPEPHVYSDIGRPLTLCIRCGQTDHDPKHLVGDASSKVHYRFHLDCPHALVHRDGHELTLAELGEMLNTANPNCASCATTVEETDGAQGERLHAHITGGDPWDVSNGGNN